MMKILIGVLCIGSTAMAQQEPQFTQFWNTLSYVNPAAGVNENTCEAFVVARNQWNKIAGNPNTQLVTYTNRLKKISNAVGGSYMHENIGFSTFHKVKATYAYQFRLGRRTFLTCGLAAGVQYMKNSGVFVTGPGIDPILDSFMVPSTRFTADFGLAFRWRKLDLGLSATQIPQRKYANGYRDALHLFGFVGYDISLGSISNYKPGFVLRPQVFLKTDLNFYTVDYNVLLKYNNTFYLGLTFRSTDSYSLMAGWDVQVKKVKFRVSYAYDMWFSKLNNGVVGGTHEIGLGFLFKKIEKKSSPYIKATGAF
jgi:type IX secretion system PorP/SprF family membrane protein